MPSRREFLETSVAGAASSAFQTSGKKTIGIQVGAVSFVDEGTDKVLDIFQESAGINTLFLAVFTYGRGIAGRQLPGQPLPDHGVRKYDLDFHGGNYGTVHPQFYRDTGIRPEDTRAPDHGALDIIAEVLPKAKKRGMRTILWTEDVWRDDIAGIEKLKEVDLYGRRSERLCVNNPQHRSFLLGLVEDYTRSYDIDGFMWGSERHGALGTVLGSSHGGKEGDPSRLGCFCEFCERKAREQGNLRIERVKEGYRVLERFVRDGRDRKRPVDGYWVTFWRILLRYPEILAWEHFWHDGLREIYAGMYRKAKSVKPDIQVGWHIWHNNSFSPFYRAEQDLAQLSTCSDFLKMVMYHNCAGERMAKYIEGMSETVFGDMPPEEALGFEYRVMNFRERALDQIPGAGFSADYVGREAKRALAGVAGTKTAIWPGIDIDIPTDQGHSKSTPQGTKDAVLAAFGAGVPGVILSRKYSEMMLANLRAAGDAIRELKFA
jgi:hypothetical protein